jgi:predicted nucleotidyltransferase component of viral defense system
MSKIKKDKTLDPYAVAFAIRKAILAAVAADEFLMERLVLKGGNALELVHGIGQRASLDMDFSTEGDFEDWKVLGDHLFTALKDRLDAAGFVLFDEKLQPRPPTSEQVDADWGGYRAEFKVINRAKYLRLNRDLDAMRRDSETVGPGHERKFTIDISKHEHCAGKVSVEVDAFPIYVYTPEMIAVEKLRAICQQMREYQRRKNPTARPRDFYDIHSIVVQKSLDLGTGGVCDKAGADRSADEFRTLP